MLIDRNPPKYNRHTTCIDHLAVTVFPVTLTSFLPSDTDPEVSVRKGWENILYSPMQDPTTSWYTVSPHLVVSLVSQQIINVHYVQTQNEDWDWIRRRGEVSTISWYQELHFHWRGCSFALCNLCMHAWNYAALGNMLQFLWLINSTTRLSIR